MWIRIMRVLFGIQWLCLIVLGLNARFKSPELTETQLLITCWPIWVGIAVSVTAWLLFERRVTHS